MYLCTREHVCQWKCPQRPEALDSPDVGLLQEQYILLTMGHLSSPRFCFVLLVCGLKKIIHTHIYLVGSEGPSLRMQLISISYTLGTRSLKVISMCVCAVYICLFIVCVSECVHIHVIVKVRGPH